MLSPVLPAAIALLVLIWALQASSDEIQEIRQQIGGLRREMRKELGEIRATQLEMGERLSRIEGFLGIGMPDEVADQAPGAGFADSAGGGE